MRTYYVRTFGCQMNFHDSEKMAGVLAEKGFTEASCREEADLIIFNTCSIREKAEQKFFSELGRLKTLKRKRPEVRIAIAGCVAQQMGERLFERAPYVDLVIGPQNIHKLKTYLSAGEGRAAALEPNPALAGAGLPALRKDWPRAWVSIVFGCNNFCSYCIVPYTRGREASRPAAGILEEVRRLAADGFKEITLLGQNVNSYKSEMDFPGLLEALDGSGGISRIRFMTSHPRDFSDRAIEALCLPSVCEHVHLPLQSGSDSVLRAMGRRYTYPEYLEKIGKIRKTLPEAAITTDIIAGFPGESEKDHAKTVQALEEIRFDGIFAFKYSARPGTAAARIPGERQVPEEVKSARLEEILSLQDIITSEKNASLKDTVVEVLVEGPSEKNPNLLTGRTRTNKVVNFKGHPELKGELQKVLITRTGRHSLTGERVL